MDSGETIDIHKNLYDLPNTKLGWYKSFSDLAAFVFVGRTQWKYRDKCIQIHFAHQREFHQSEDFNFSNYHFNFGNYTVFLKTATFWNRRGSLWITWQYSDFEFVL